MFKQSSNLAIRLVAQGLRFVFLLFVVKFLSTQDYIEFGVIYALITAAIIACGFEMHVSFNRDVARKKKLYLQNMREQLLSILPFFIVTATVLAAYVHGADRQFPLLIIALLFTEYFSQECSRLLISMQMQLLASLNILLRTGAWTPISLALLYQSDAPTLLHVYGPWFVASCLSLIICVAILRKRAQFKHLGKSLQFTTVFKAKLQASWRYFVIAIAIQLVVSFDRFLAQGLLSENQLASYIFYSTLSSSLSSIYIPFIQNIYQPKLINLWGKSAYDAEIKNYVYSSILTVAACVLLLLVSHPIVLRLVTKDFLNEFYSIFMFTLVVSTIKTLSNIPHTIAFSKSLDGVIWKATLFSFFGLSIIWLFAIFLHLEILFYIGILQFHTMIFLLKWRLKK